MKRRIFFPDTKPGIKLFWLIFLVVLSALVFSILGLVVGKLIFHSDLSSLLEMLSQPESETAKSFLYIFQLINQVGMFILPPLLFAYLFSTHSGRYLKISRMPSLMILLLAGLSIFTVLPLINWLTEVNAHMTFPGTLAGVGEWMKAKEVQADRLTEVFLQVKSPGGLAMNLLVIALIPALGEELLFRGLLQRLLGEWTKNIHVGVILTAFIFSALHLQFFGFLPRFLLGLMLGYLLEITQSLWVPIFTHFVNNATLVIIFYLHYNGFMATKMEDFGSSQNYFVIAFSLLLTVGLFYGIKRNSAVDSKGTSGHLRQL
jgi:membrane protease YdiL (CAAX protease family)